MNPFVLPAIEKLLTSVVYYRLNYILFNLGTYFIGFYALYICINKFKIKNLLYLLLFICATLLMINNCVNYFHFTYEPENNFDPIYKLNSDEVDISLKLKDIINIEGLQSPKVISQVYGIMLIEPEIYNVFSVPERRNSGYNLSGDILELYKIFATPIFAGDDSIRKEAKNQEACKLLIDQKIDFVIVDKQLSYINEYNHWVPLNWAIRDCMDNIYENDRYALYRFYW